MPYLPSSSARLIFCGPDPPDPPLAGSDPDLCEDDPFTPFAPVAPPPAPFTAVVVAAAVGAGAGAGVGLTLAPPARGRHGREVEQVVQQVHLLRL